MKKNLSLIVLSWILLLALTHSSVANAQGDDVMISAFLDKVEHVIVDAQVRLQNCFVSKKANFEISNLLTVKFSFLKDSPSPEVTFFRPSDPSSQEKCVLERLKKLNYPKWAGAEALEMSRDLSFTNRPEVNDLKEIRGRPIKTVQPGFCQKKQTILARGECDACFLPLMSESQDRTFAKEKASYLGPASKDGSCAAESGVCGPYRYVQYKDEYRDSVLYFDKADRLISAEYSEDKMTMCGNFAMAKRFYYGMVVDCQKRFKNALCSGSVKARK